MGDGGKSEMEETKTTAKMKGMRGGFERVSSVLFASQQGCDGGIDYSGETRKLPTLPVQ